MRRNQHRCKGFWGFSIEAEWTIKQEMEAIKTRRLLGAVSSRNYVGHADRSSGMISEAGVVLTELVELQSVRCVSPLDFALIYARLGKTAGVF